MDLEKLISSSCRRKIIKFLWKTNYVNIMELVLKINSTYNQVNANLLILSQEGVTEEKRYGRVRMIKLNKENPKTLFLLQALKILNT